jgi:4-hydroxyacetophenone monooxygenase
MRKINKKVIVIGSGISGICAGVKLREKNIDFLILEKNQNIGGTWWENVYPGSACDVPGYFYCFSFMKNKSWSTTWPS